ncbi:MAG: DUF1629 domain-containing protein [Hellea sp.]
MNEVWMSSALTNYLIGNKQGTADKYFDRDWEPAKFEKPLRPDEVHAAGLRHVKGEFLERHDFPEASYVFDVKKFSRIGDFFYAGGFVVVRRRLAEILADMDLGKGELIPYTIYEGDKETPLEEEFFLLNFGEQKDSFLPNQSQKVREFFTSERHGIEVWNNKYANDNDIALSSDALRGADLWFEPKLRMMMFMSERLALAIQKANIKPDLSLVKCRVIGIEA